MARMPGWGMTDRSPSLRVTSPKVRVVVTPVVAVRLVVRLIRVPPPSARMLWPLPVMTSWPGVVLSLVTLHSR